MLAGLPRLRRAMPSRQNAPLIAECDTCGKPFLGGEIKPSGQVVLGIGAVYGGRTFSMRSRDEQGMTIGNAGPGQTGWSGVTLSCPQDACEGWGSIPDGFVDWFTGAVTLFASTPAAQLTALAETLRSYMAGKATEAEVIAAAPPAATTWLQEAIAKYHLKFVYAVVLLILAITGGQSAIASDLSAADRLLRKAVAAIVQHPPKPKRPPPTRAKPPDTARAKPAVLPQLNDVCWCGSGRKYRRCHRVDR